MNDENGAAIVSKLGPQTKFFVCNVLETDSIKAAVDGTVAWVKETGKPLGGVIPAAGVSTPATVRDILLALALGLELHFRRQTNTSDSYTDDRPQWRPVEPRRL
jgi:hypothetical protein